MATNPQEAEAVHHRRDRAGVGMSGFVRNHPLACYFVLAYALTWLAWTPYVLSLDGVGIWRVRLPEFLHTLTGAYLGPIVGAFVVTAVADGRAGLGVWVRRLLRWRVGWRWYLAVVLGVPAAIVLGTLPLPGAAEAFRLPAVGVLLAYVPVLGLQMVTTGLAEEPGWRDFAQPRLQQRYGPLAGALILGPLWGAWHLPLFVTQWMAAPQVGGLMVAEFLGTAVALSIVMSWVFNQTGESVPVVMLLHAGVNAFSSMAWDPIFPGLDPWLSLRGVLIAASVLAVGVVAATRGRLGYQPVAESGHPSRGTVGGLPARDR